MDFLICANHWKLILRRENGRYSILRIIVSIKCRSAKIVKFYRNEVSNFLDFFAINREDVVNKSCFVVRENNRIGISLYFAID